jgi:hypothetical protein
LNVVLSKSASVEKAKHLLRGVVVFNAQIMAEEVGRITDGRRMWYPISLGACCYL